MQAIIQAGGKGSRLRPYTLVLPKPMMPVGNQPVIEMLLKWLRRNGIEEAYITLGYLGHLIRALCGDGQQWGMSIGYSEEPEPLGTVGALDLLRDKLDDTFLVLNGDLITDLDLRAFHAFHKEKGGMLSVATTEKRIHVDLGVIESEKSQIVGFREKPTVPFQVSMGIYLMEAAILDHIPKGIPYGFDDLTLGLLDKGIPIYTYRHEGSWMDIGRQEDFIEAQKLVEDDGLTVLGV